MAHIQEARGMIAKKKTSAKFIGKKRVFEKN